MAVNFRRIWEGLQIKAKTSTSADTLGELEVVTATTKIGYHNGTTVGYVVTETHASQGANRLQNKDLDASTSKIVDPSDTAKKVGFDVSGATTATTTTLDFNQTANRTITFPDASGTLLTTDSAGVITNKDLDDSTVKFVDTGDNTKTIKFDAGGTTGTSSTITGAQTANRVITLPDGTTTLVGTDFAAILTNKSIDADTNTITNIENADIKTGAAIDRAKIASTSANHVVINNGSGALSTEAQLAGSRGGTGVNNGGTLTYGNDNVTIVTSGASNVTIPTTGTLATLAGIETLTNKALVDNSTSIVDNTDATKKILFDAGGTTGTSTTFTAAQTANRVITAPDATTTILGHDTAQVVTNKDIDGGTASNTNRITIPKDTKTNLDGLTRKAATVVYASDQTKFYGDNGSLLVPLGGGAGGVNFMRLNTSWSDLNSDNSDLENSIGSWVTYDDGSAIPVDLTGGSAAQLTLSRTTTAGEILDGVASLKVVKAAADAMGEGISCTLNVPPAYQGKQCQITIPFKVASGSIVSGDIYCYIYDVTNSQLITPFNNSIYGTQGTLQAMFSPASPASTPANQNLRIGIHFATTSATAVTLLFDDIVVGPILEGAIGGAVSDWGTQYVVAPSVGFGTVTNSAIKTRRVGDSLECVGFFNVGTTAANSAALTLPTGLTIDTTKISSSTDAQRVGTYTKATSGSLSVASSTYALYFNGSTTTAVFFADTVVSNKFDSSNNVSGLFAASQGVSFTFIVPIAQWSTNVTLSSSSKFNLSSVIANGTRVTSTPAALGEYRTYKKTASSRAGTDDAPSTAPSTANGMLIYGVAYGSAGTAGQTNRWEIFVGKNKSVKFEFYSSAGKTGYICTDLTSNGATVYGTDYTYNPTTGVVLIDAQNQYSDTTSRRVGKSVGTGGAEEADAASCYFDVIVSENALAVGVERPRSEVWVYDVNGHGSTNTRIRRFVTTGKSTGSAITYADSATLGNLFTINEDGLYAIAYSDNFNTTGGMGVSVNSSQLTTSISSITAADRRAMVYNAQANISGTCALTLFLSKGDLVRAHTEGSGTGSNPNDRHFRITKISD